MRRSSLRVSDLASQDARGLSQGQNERRGSAPQNAGCERTVAEVCDDVHEEALPAAEARPLHRAPVRLAAAAGGDERADVLDEVRREAVLEAVGGDEVAEDRDGAVLVLAEGGAEREEGGGGAGVRWEVGGVGVCVCGAGWVCECFRAQVLDRLVWQHALEADLRGGRARRVRAGHKGAFTRQTTAAAWKSLLSRLVEDMGERAVPEVVAQAREGHLQGARGCFSPADTPPEVGRRGSCLSTAARRRRGCDAPDTRLGPAAATGRSAGRRVGSAVQGARRLLVLVRDTQARVSSEVLDDRGGEVAGPDRVLEPVVSRGREHLWGRGVHTRWSIRGGPGRAGLGLLRRY